MALSRHYKDPSKQHCQGVTIATVGLVDVDVTLGRWRVAPPAILSRGLVSAAAEV
jgi:hypothetical protein